MRGVFWGLERCRRSMREPKSTTRVPNNTILNIMGAQRRAFMVARRQTSCSKQVVKKRNQFPLRPSDFYILHVGG